MAQGLRSRSEMLGLYWRTARFLRPRQIFFRFWRLISLRYRPVSLNPIPQFRAPRALWGEGPQSRACLTSPDMFEIHGYRINLRTSNWRPQGLSDLALYNVHYFSDLNCSDGVDASQWAASLIDDWCAHFTDPEFPAWDPYPLSVRCVNWMKWALRGHAISEVARCTLYRQGQFLARNLEWHLDGNHLFVNAKALLFFGLFFEGKEAEGWFKTGLRILQRELDHQVLSDGGHYERSPAYHALLLIDLLELKNLELVYQLALDLPLDQKIREMKLWLDALTHPDGSLAHFNDTVDGMVCSRDEIEAYLGRLNIALSPESGDQLFNETQFARAERGPAVLFVDYGGPGPDHIPGHAHAESLSFELSLGGKPLIRNCGISTYQRGEQRLIERGTAAHNTLCYASQNSSEVWASFRVGARARGYLHQADLDQGEFLLNVSHDGYCRFERAAEHFRQFILERGQLIILDEMGGGLKKQLYFHFAPDIHLKVDATGRAMECQSKGRAIAWVSCEGGQISAIDSFICLGYEKTIFSSAARVTLDSNQCSTKISWG